MKNEIRQLMCVHLPLAEEASAEIIFPATFIGFQGHFADRPVLPGVCLVLAALVLSEHLDDTALTIREIVSAKFFTPVAPDVPVRISCRMVDHVVRAKISGNTGRIAEVKIKVDHA